MQEAQASSRARSIALSLLSCLLALLALPSAAGAWDYQLRYTVPDDGGVDEYRVYLEAGASGYQLYTEIQGPLIPDEVHAYDLIGLPDDQDVAIVMTSCRYDDGVPVESGHSNELFFPAEPVCVDSSCDDGNPCTLDYCFEGACMYDGLPMDAEPCDDGDPATSGDICGEGTCSGTPVPPPECTVDIDCVDSDPCNGDEWCNTDVGACLPGTALSCPDPGQCQVASCDPAFGCVVDAVANGTACDDGDPATSGDVCSEGACAGTSSDSTSEEPCSDGSRWRNPNSCKNGKDDTKTNQRGGRGRNK
jgi:hypothetical protein